MQGNKTYQIVQHAREHSYAVAGVCVYNLEGVMATIRAAEAARSPVLIQLFPWAMHFYGAAFVEYVAKIAHAASVPVGVHLDHCLKRSDAELALTMAFDSIMIDGSTFANEDEGTEYCREMTQAALQVGKTVEVELGRMEGKEDGVPTEGLEGVMTNPDDAAAFVTHVGPQFLAPSFGNVHGSYGPKGPELDFERVKRIRAALPDSVPLVLHGTTGIPEDQVKLAISLGFAKININKGCRLKVAEYLQTKAGHVELTAQMEATVEIYADEIKYYLDLFGSTGRA